MRRILSVLFVVLFASAISGVTSWVEGRTKLHGAYAFTTARSCTVTNSSPTGTPFGIDPTGMPTLIPTGGVFRQEAADSGVETFNEDGTGISIGRSKTMNTSNTNVGVSIVSISEFSTPFTFVVNDDDTVEINFGVTTATILLGSGAGDTVTVSGRLARAQIADGGKIILSAPATTIEEETLNFNVPNDGAFSQVRLCTRSSTAAKLRGERDDDH